MGKVIDLKDVFLRSSEEAFEPGDDQFFVWDGEGLVCLETCIPQVDDAPVVSIARGR